MFKKIKFNELFINLYEDCLLSYQLKNFDLGIMDYRIGSFMGKSLGNMKGGLKVRKLKNALFGTIVFDYLLNKIETKGKI